ncbi:MAG: hypothetical protein Q9222_006422 [Ikaeria aurantiellina]
MSCSMLLAIDSFCEVAPHIVISEPPRASARCHYSCSSIQEPSKKDSKSPHKDLYHKMIKDERRILNRRNRLHRLMPPFLLKRAHSWHGLMKKKSPAAHDEETLALLEKATATTEPAASSALSETSSVDLEVRMPPKRTNTSPNENTLAMKGSEKREIDICDTDSSVSSTSSTEYIYPVDADDSPPTPVVAVRFSSFTSKPLLFVFTSANDNPQCQLPVLPPIPPLCESCDDARHAISYPDLDIPLVNAAETSITSDTSIAFDTSSEDDQLVDARSRSSSAYSSEEEDGLSDSGSSDSQPTSFLSMAPIRPAPAAETTVVSETSSEECECSGHDADDDEGYKREEIVADGYVPMMSEGAKRRRSEMAGTRSEDRIARDKMILLL